MKFLREVASIVTKYGGNSRNIKLPIEGRRGNRLSFMFVNLLQGKYRTDAEAALDIYNVEPTYPKYRKLKSRVKERLFNTLFLLEIKQPKNSAVLESYYWCNKNITFAKLLIALGGRSAGVMLAHKTLLKAQKAHLFDIVLQCAQLLRSHYSLMGMEKQFQEYDKMIGVMLRILVAENEADRLNQLLRIKYARSTSRKVEFASLAKEFVAKVSVLKNEFPTETIMMNYFRVKSIYCQIEHNAQAIIDVCNEAESFLSEYPHFSTRPRLAEFALTKMVAYLQMRDYVNGESNAHRCQSLFISGTNNWLTFMDYYFLLALHSRNFVKAVDIFQVVMLHPRLIAGPQFRLEKWRVHEGYLNYVFESGWDTVQSSEVELFRKRFNVNKFLNEVPLFSKDKRGMNVSILILQILFLIERGQFDAIASRTDALRVYSSRYLRRDENYRSELFIRMLLTMESKSFDYKKTLVATQGYQSRLLATATGKHGSLDGTEVIPFELLWDRILIKLRKGVGVYSDE